MIRRILEAIGHINWSYDHEALGLVGYQRGGEGEYIGHKGYTVQMPIHRFLMLNPPVDKNKKGREYLKAAMEEGSKVAPPFLNVEWDEENKLWRVYGHEGRTRATVAGQLVGDGMHIPVTVFPYDGGTVRLSEMTRRQRQEMYTLHADKRAGHDNYRVVVRPATVEGGTLECINEDAKGPRLETLKKNKRSLTPEERAECKKLGIMWHSGPKNELQCAARKAVVKDKTWWWCGTHRTWSGAEPTLKALKKHWESVKASA